MQQALKIVVTGAYAAGKTQFIRTISDIDMLSTEYEVTHAEERKLKQQTTVALDFGKIAISDEAVLYIFGTPGQQRFDFMWEHLSIGCLGYIVMVDSCRPAHFAETRQLMDRFLDITDAPYIAVANKQDNPAALPLSYMRRRLQLPPEIPLLPCAATDRSSVKHVLLALLEHIQRQTLETEHEVRSDREHRHAPALPML
jgi:signal recognition particle receptor subunit beta